jgi:hypothetical protein
MPYLRKVNDEIIEWRLSFDEMHFTCRNVSFPSAVPNGLVFDQPEIYVINTQSYVIHGK